ncbi:MAG: hypothetical protein LBH76_01035 [Propionibacteriaceae bacterium]|jgi:hypothetical protein|nr:hypothetical protein [Propionibacteriaceae bacterium]
MGIRSLPLLSDWAVAQWESGTVEAAAQAAGKRVFGEAWAEVWSLPAPAAGGFSSWVGQVIQGDAVTSTATSAVADAVAQLDGEDEPRLLDLAGLLALYAAGQPSTVESEATSSYFRAVAYTLALTAEAARHFDSCDSRLSAAYVLSIVSAAHIGPVIDRYKAAVDNCPGDPTPRVELERAKLTMYGDDGRMWESQAEKGEWASVEADLTTLVAALPGVAAAHALAGDVTSRWHAGRRPSGRSAFDTSKSRPSLPINGRLGSRPSRLSGLPWRKPKSPLRTLTPPRRRSTPCRPTQTLGNRTVSPLSYLR